MDRRFEKAREEMRWRRLKKPEEKRTKGTFLLDFVATYCSVERLLVTLELLPCCPIVVLWFEVFNEEV